MQNFSIVCSQLNPGIGDFQGNLKLIIESAMRAVELEADLLVLPEMILEGYPAQDWAMDATFRRTSSYALQTLLYALDDHAPGLTVVFGAMAKNKHRKNRNALYVVRGSKILGVKGKKHLPQYGVFDEERFFAPDDEPLVLDLFGTRIGFAVCEDLWHADSAEDMKRLGAQMIVSINASPYERGKRQERERTVTHNALGLPVVYVNRTGGQDELIFDGNSFVADAGGHIFKRAAAFEPDDMYVDATDLFEAHEDSRPGETDIHAELYDALCLAVRDYVHKAGFEDVTLGLSGGVDSALVAAIAVDALGHEHVHAVGMPTRYTSDLSITLAKQLADNLKLDFVIRPIDDLFASYVELLAADFAGRAWDLTEENLQARIRGTVLMAHSNKFNRLVLTTGNKSETAVGYSTLYGDTAGAFAVIKDVLKTDVWEMCRYVNRKAGWERIPPAIIGRAPSAELRENQTDEDTLPRYAVLDTIIRMYVEERRSPEEIIEAGFERAMVKRVLGLIHRAEYKRRQSPIGPKVSAVAFGADWRYPIINRFDPWKVVPVRFDEMVGEKTQDDTAEAPDDEA